MSAPAVPEAQVADYALLGLLGDGSQGSVFLASPPERVGARTTRVAVKVMALKVPEAGFRRAVEELKAYACARSPHLTRLLEVGRHDDGTIYYAMEYAPGGSLATPAGPVSETAALRAIAAAARGAHALHEAGVVHRAIKPANVLLFGEEAKLADLDLQHLISPGQTVSARSPVRLIQYLDPGLIRGNPASRVSDVYALGVTLHTALTGRPIFSYGEESDLMTALKAVMQGEPQIDSALGRDLRELIRSCLAWEPAERLPTAAAVAERIEGIVADR